MGTGSPLSDLRLPSFLSRSGVKERPTRASSGGDAKMRCGMCPRPKAVQHKALRDTTRSTLGFPLVPTSRSPFSNPPIGHLSSVNPRESNLRVSHALQRHPCRAPPAPPGARVKL